MSTKDQLLANINERNAVVAIVGLGVCRAAPWP